MKKNWLKAMVAISAFLIAGSAAFFSVTGLGVLFSGASTAVMIMAGSLEFAKLTTATYLKQSWDTVRGFNKWYLTSAVGILMVITSAGIFGYLSNAFQQQNIKLEQVKREVSVWDNKIKSNETQINMLTNQLNNLESNQGKIIENGKVNRSLLRSVDNRDKEASLIRNKISSLQDSSVVYNSKINDVKNNNIGIEREVGGFRFVAEAFGVELNSVVKFFIILIVIVFDPLALALIIAFNQLVMGENDPKEDEKVDIDVDDIKNVISESDRLKPNENELNNIESILSKKQYINREDIVKSNDDHKIKVYGEIKPDGETNLPKDTYTPPKSREVYPAVSDEEVEEMNQDEYENYNGHNLSNFEENNDDEYIPTKEEEEQNFSTITPPEELNDTNFSIIKPKMENNFQQEDYKGQFEDWKNETVTESFATPEEVEEQVIDTPIEEVSKVETIEEPIQEEPEEKKK